MDAYVLRLVIIIITIMIWYEILYNTVYIKVSTDIWICQLYCWGNEITVWDSITWMGLGPTWQLQESYG